MSSPQDEIKDMGIKETAGFRNLIGIRDYTVATRKMFRELEARMEYLEKKNRQLEEENERQKMLISGLQQKLINF